MAEVFACPICGARVYVDEEGNALGDMEEERDGNTETEIEDCETGNGKRSLTKKRKWDAT